MPAHRLSPSKSYDDILSLLDRTIKGIAEANPDVPSETVSLWVVHHLARAYAEAYDKDAGFLTESLGDCADLHVPEAVVENLSPAKELIENSYIPATVFGVVLQLGETRENRSKHGVHYTSYDDIMKVLHPLFLDYLEADLAAAGDDEDKLEALLLRISRIRVFDPACGSGNFLTTAYTHMRDIETRALIMARRAGDRTGMKLSQFFGIEYNAMASRVAKVALTVEAWMAGDTPEEGCTIVQGDSLRLSWDTVCPVPEDREAYIVGNPPFLGKGKRSPEQQEGLRMALGEHVKTWKSLDYVAGWFFKAGEYVRGNKNAEAALVSTNSICQGSSVPALWPHILTGGVEIGFAYRSFNWRTHSASSAGVTCVIVCLRCEGTGKPKYLYGDDI